jgi:tetraacyldisaccharide 4'-kinase
MSINAKLQTWIATQWQRRGLWSTLMRPLACAYGLVANHRRQAYLRGRQQTFKARVPVIVIGNIYVGGTGKTPLTIAVAKLLRSQGWRPALVSRGFGRLHREASAVGHGANLDWQVFGDEPALIARETGMPVAVDRNRAIAAQALLAQYPDTDIIISDDGLQHYRLARDFEILVQDERGVGNGLLLPAGPLREPASRRDEVNLVLTRGQLPLASTQPGFGIKIDGFCHLASGEVRSVEHFLNRCQPQLSIVAVAAIGVPKRFFSNLTDLGIHLSATYALVDHEAMDLAWLKGLPAETILITEKDAVKLSHQEPDPRVWVAQTSVHWWRDDIGVFFVQRLAQAGIQHPELRDGP